MGSSDDAFAICINHGGELRLLDGDKFYVGGDLHRVLDLDADMYGYLDLEDSIEKLGYVSWKSITYKLPNSSNYVELRNDADVMAMLSKRHAKCRVFHIYVDCGKKSRVDLASDEEVLGDNDDVAAGFEKFDGEEVQIQNGYGFDGEEVQIQNGYGFDSSEEELDYIPVENEDYTDDDLADDELVDDFEYINARRILRDTSHKGVCDEVFAMVEYEHGHSDIEQNGDINSEETDEEQDGMRNLMRRAVYDPAIDPKNLKLTLGMRFEDGLEARDAIKENAIEDGRGIHFRRVSRVQMEAYCKPPCKWKCYGSIVRSTGHFIIKTLIQPHTCTTAMRNNQVTYTWIANKYLDVYRYRPDLSVKELRQDILRRYNCLVGRWKLYKAKERAVQMLRGTVNAHYAKLRDYVLELKRADPQGRFDLWLDWGAVFKGFYVGFSGLKKGFQAGCRRVIGIDGAFLKTYLGGVLLCAVGNDANNHMYPIAWAVVEVENKVNWTWFLKILMEELDLSTGAGTVFISDQQKGLLNAVAEIAPFAEHRNCARHVYINWKKSNGNLILRNMFWKAVNSTHKAEFNASLDAMKAKDVKAYEGFIGRDITKFCKVFINPSSLSDMILNNSSETFNGYIVQARGKHLIHMLEEIRTSLMERLNRKRVALNGYGHSICPEIWKKVEKLKHFSRYCVPHAASDVLFEVEHFGDRFVVDVSQRTCTCNSWNITGIPCIHACSAIHNLLREEAIDYCHEAYSVAKYHATYRFGLPPLNGELMWPRAEGYPVVPPAVKKMPGRPKKKRKRNPCEENPKNPTKLRRNGVRMTCSQCKQIGHNRATCKNAGVPKAKQKGKAGRPQKNQGASTSAQAGASSSATITSISAASASPTPTPTTGTSQSNSATTSSVKRPSTRGMTNLSRETMGSAGLVTGVMPTQKKQIFIPPRPRTKKSSKEKANPTQDNRS